MKAVYLAASLLFGALGAQMVREANWAGAAWSFYVGIVTALYCVASETKR